MEGINNVDDLDARLQLLEKRVYGERGGKLNKPVKVIRLRHVCVCVREREWVCVRACVRARVCEWVSEWVSEWVCVCIDVDLTDDISIISQSC